MTARPRHRGFVLLMALVVLALAGTLLVAAARRSCDVASRAASEQENLQVRWGSLSCQAVCLPAAEAILAQAARSAPSACVQRSVVLGGMVFDVILSDEQAKANANQLYRQGDEMALSAKLLRLQGGLKHVLPVRLAPTPPAEGTGAKADPFSSLEQVFTFEGPSEVAPLPPDLDSVAARITCWGNGRINFKRADPTVLREFLASEGVGIDATGLVMLRSAKPTCTLADALGQLRLSGSMTLSVRRVLTDTSQCHSVWVIARGTTRSWYRLCVEPSVTATGQGPAGQGPMVFSW